MQETCTLRMYLSSNLPTSTVPYKGLPKIHMLQMRWNIFIPTCHIFKSNEAHLKTVIKKLEGELREEEKRFTEVGNPDHDAFTIIEGSMKKRMKKLGENVMKNLLNELQDSKREMEKKLNHVMIQTKSYAESVQNTSQDKNQTPNGTYIDFRAIMEETKNAELVEEKEKKLRSKSLIIYDVEHLLVTTRMALSKIWRNLYKRLHSCMKGNIRCKTCIENRSPGPRQESTY